MGGYATVSEEPTMDASTTRSEDVDLQHVETREGQKFAAHVPDWADKAKLRSVKGRTEAAVV